MSPRFSIITPVYNTDAKHLEQCIASVIDQTFADWELCLVNDKSSKSQVRSILDRASKIDDRIRVEHRSVNGGIVAASNDALRMAHGDFVALLDHDDVLEPDALASVEDVLRSDSSIDYVYTDETLMTGKGRIIERFHKPDWSPERFRHQMYVCHLSVIRRQLVTDLGGFREGFDGAQDYDLMLRVTEQARRVGHVPKLLYHWRMAATSVANNASAKPYAYDAGRRAIEAHFERTGVAATVERLEAFPGNYRVVRHLKQPRSVDVFVPNTGANSYAWGVDREDHQATVADLLKSTSYPMNITSVTAFGHGSLDEALRKSTADVLVLASESLESCSQDWVRSLLSPLENDKIGIVSGVTYTANSRLQHAGFSLSGSFVESFLCRLARNNRGQRAVLETTFEVSAADWQCLGIKRSVYETLGGFDQSLEHPWVVIDFCLRAKVAGFATVICPEAEFLEFSDNDDFARRRVRAPKNFRKKWSAVFSNDPYRAKTPLGLSVESNRPMWRPKGLRDFQNHN